MCPCILCEFKDLLDSSATGAMPKDAEEGGVPPMSAPEHRQSGAAEVAFGFRALATFRRRLTVSVHKFLIGDDGFNVAYATSQEFRMCHFGAMLAAQRVSRPNFER